MRDIKFKAVIDDNQLIKVLSLNADGSVIVRFGLESGFIPSHRVKAIIQYTGLKDKNGVEIYEGDICKCNYFIGSKVKQHNEVVEFKSGQFELTWTINKLFKSFRSRSCFHGHPDAFEVIGNIYENPELLEQSK